MTLLLGKEGENVQSGFDNMRPKRNPHSTTPILSALYIILKILNFEVLFLKNVLKRKENSKLKTIM